MANVRVCDRCGEQLKKIGAFISLKPTIFICGIEYSYKTNTGLLRTGYVERDLCPNCADKLALFMDGRKLEDEQ